MLEVQDRCGAARAATWSFEGHTVRTPNVLFAVTPRHPAPPFGDALIAHSKLDDPRPTFVDRGSLFRPLEIDGGLAIPPDAASPAALPDLERPPAPAGLVIVAVSPDAIREHPEAQIVAVGDAVAYLRRPKAFAGIVVALRRGMGYARLLYVPGLATPGNLAVLAYCGADLVDSTRVAMESTLGRFHRADGSWPASDVDAEMCHCPACLEGDGRDLEAHNARALLTEVRHVSTAIRGGRLRELAERRAANDAWNTAVLRELDLRHAEWQEYHAPVDGGPMLAYSTHSLQRPEVLRFRARLRERYAKPPTARVLVLLPCSARKPYETSRSHRRFRDAIARVGNPHAVHEVIVTSPFGLVPRELERMYPVAHYDVPVTGDWSRDEIAVIADDLRDYLGRNSYDAVLAHVDTEAPFVIEAARGAIHTAKGRPTSDASLGALTQALRTALGDGPKVGARDRLLENLRNVATFQFGPEGAALLDGATLRGRYPNVRIHRSGTQVGMFTERGKISLTLAGGTLLSERDVHWVEIEDFHPEGSVFAVGVTGADDRVRVGDEVVVRHGGDVRAVGVAAMNPREMVDLQRGAAVKVRHKARKKD